MYDSALQKALLDWMDIKGFRVKNLLYACILVLLSAFSGEGKDDASALQRQDDQMDGVTYSEHYIETVINEGSDVLNLSVGNMAAGYTDPSDASKIAAYVMTLSGREPGHPEYVREGSLYYAGNCSGCHGTDGKGDGGKYPDLTLRILKGVQLKKDVLRRRIDIPDG